MQVAPTAQYAIAFTGKFSRPSSEPDFSPRPGIISPSLVELMQNLALCEFTNVPCVSQIPGLAEDLGQVLPGDRVRVSSRFAGTAP
jgi:hypothetical protein